MKYSTRTLSHTRTLNNLTQGKGKGGGGELVFCLAQAHGATIITKSIIGKRYGRLLGVDP